LAIEHREHDAEELDLGVPLGPDAIDEREELAHRSERERLGLERREHVRRRLERARGHLPEAGGAVEEHHVELALELREQDRYRAPARERLLEAGDGRRVDAADAEHMELRISCAREHGLER